MINIAFIMIIAIIAMMIQAGDIYTLKNIVKKHGDRIRDLSTLVSSMKKGHTQAKHVKDLSKSVEKLQYKVDGLDSLDINITQVAEHIRTILLRKDALLHRICVLEQNLREGDYTVTKSETRVL